MKGIVQHYGRVRNGKVIFDIASLYDDQLRELEGKQIVMTIKERHKSPTKSQYGYYRGCILPICYETEMFSAYDNKDEIHEFYFADKFLSYTIKDPKTGKEKQRVRSLSDITDKEMSVFIERVLAECAELGIEIPPSEMYYNKYYEK